MFSVNQINFISLENSRSWLPTALGQNDPLGKPASNLGMLERRNLESIQSIHNRTELRTDVSTGVNVTSNSAGVKIGGDQCIGRVMKNG